MGLQLYAAFAMPYCLAAIVFDPDTVGLGSMPTMGQSLATHLWRQTVRTHSLAWLRVWLVCVPCALPDCDGKDPKYNSLERLDLIRKTFFYNNNKSFGQKKMKLEVQVCSQYRPALISVCASACVYECNLKWGSHGCKF